MQFKKNRLEAFSDGVIAIIITIMVLEMQAPKGKTFSDLLEVIPTFIGYLLSYIFVATYWLNHHRLFEIIKSVNTKILWANLNFLLWLSLIPFATSWLGNITTSTNPVMLYAVLILISSFSYKLLVKLVIENEGGDGRLIRAFSKDKRSLFERLLNASAVLSAFIHPNIAIFILALVAITKIIPDKKLNAAYSELLKIEEKDL